MQEIILTCWYVRYVLRNNINLPQWLLSPLSPHPWLLLPTPRGPEMLVFNQTSNKYHKEKNRRGEMSNLIVHGIVESIELVWTVESDASEASFLCDSDRWVGEDGGDGGRGGGVQDQGGVIEGGGDGAEGADHCSAVITEYSVARPGYICYGGRTTSVQFVWNVLIGQILPCTSSIMTDVMWKKDQCYKHRCSVHPNTRRFIHPNPSIHPSIHLLGLGVFKNHPRPSETIRDQTRPSEAIWDQDRPGQIRIHLDRPAQTCIDLHKPG